MKNLVFLSFFLMLLTIASSDVMANEVKDNNISEKVKQNPLRVNAEYLNTPRLYPEAKTGIPAKKQEKQYSNYAFCTAILSWLIMTLLTIRRQSKNNNHKETVDTLLIIMERVTNYTIRGVLWPIFAPSIFRTKPHH